MLTSAISAIEALSKPCGGAVADVTWTWVKLVPVSIWIKMTHVNDGNGGRVNLVVDGDGGQWKWR